MTPAHSTSGSKPRRFSTRRRAAIAVASVAMLALGPITAALHASAAAPAMAPRITATKAPLGSVNVSATATGIRAPLYSHQGEDAELELPFAAAQLGAGGTGHALTSIFWPGSTGGALGSTLGVLGVKGLPTSLTNSLNDPEKAEAPTTDGKEVVVNNQGLLTMTAIAHSNHVKAQTNVGPATSPTLDQLFGSIRATTNIVQQANKVVVDAKSAIANVSIANVLSIGAITSTAHAVSNGKHSSGTTSTTITGLKIAGINVTVDQNGVEVTGKGLLPPSVLQTLSKTVNTALKAAGVRIFVARGIKQIHGPQVTLDAGDLIISITKPGYKSGVNDTGILLELGGASINASASPGYVAPTLPSSVPPSTPPAPPATNPSTGVLPPGPTGGSSLPPVVASSSPAPALTPEIAPTGFKLPGALGAGWIVLGLALAGLFAYGMKRLPDQVLAGSGSVCNLEEGS